MGRLGGCWMRLGARLGGRRLAWTRETQTLIHRRDAETRRKDKTDGKTGSVLGGALMLFLQVLRTPRKARYPLGGSAAGECSVEADGGQDQNDSFDGGHCVVVLGPVFVDVGPEGGGLEIS